MFFLVNATYIFLIWDLVDRGPADDVSPKVRAIMHGNGEAGGSPVGVGWQFDVDRRAACRKQVAAGGVHKHHRGARGVVNVPNEND